MRALPLILYLNFVLVLNLFGKSNTSLKKQLLRIDSIVNSANTYAALEEIGPLYLAYKKIDSTSEKFQKLSREYIYILEKSELNEEAISLANSLLSRKIDSDKFHAELFILLARLHEKIGNEDLCRSRLYMAKSLLQSIENDSLELVWRIRMSSYHRIYRSKDSAKYFAELAFQQAEKINQPLHKATASFLLAFLSNDTHYQLERFRYSKNVYQKNTDITGTLAMCLALHKTYLKLEDSINAKFYLDTIGTFIINTPYIGSKAWYYETLSNHFRSVKKFDSALFYLDSVRILSDKLKEKQDRVKLLTQDLKFSNESLKADLRDKQLENKVLIFFSVIVILLMVFIVILAFDQKKKRRIINSNRDVIKKRNEELQVSLEKNETLLMELNHRVKNNLATLGGLLRLQASKTKDVQVKEQLASSINRINTLSEIYKRALENDDLGFSDSKELIVSICKAQFALSGRGDNMLKLNIEEHGLHSKQITPVVLSLNELLTNAIKYSDENTEVKVAISSSDDLITCSVSNHGKGLPSNFSIENNDSVGLYIVKILVSQLGGKLSWVLKDNLFTIWFTFRL